MSKFLIAILVLINVVTFFVYGIDKWKARHNRWRIPEAVLLGLAAAGGSIGAWLGMRVWHHKTMHKKFQVGVPMILAAQIALVLLCSCGTAGVSQRASDENARIERDNVSVLARKVLAYGQSHPDGFTLDIRTFAEPAEGIAVSYAATQDSHSLRELKKVVRHALRHYGYVGSWYNSSDSLYDFDSTRLFPEDSLGCAIKFARENGQMAVFVLSEAREIPIE
jgi:uncharacterized membrane protein YsdA (DUF1294 family)